MISDKLIIADLRQEVQLQQDNVKKTVRRCLDLEQELAELRVLNSQLAHKNMSLQTAINLNKHVIETLREDLRKANANKTLPGIPDKTEKGAGEGADG
jgi:hypothetical protein